MIKTDRLTDPDPLNIEKIQLRRSVGPLKDKLVYILAKVVFLSATCFIKMI